MMRLVVLALVVSLIHGYNNGVGEFPPMGWNTWCTADVCGLKDKCDEQLIKEIADAIVDEGLDKLGYEYVNMDDCWSAKTRNATGHLQPDPDRFPGGMKNLADYVHSKGLKLGVYTCVGTEVCRNGLPGSFDKYEIDAQTVAEWGVDFVKADNCHRPGGFTEKELYTRFSQALNKTGRPILFSLCEWGKDNVWEWGGELGQMYRFQMDHLPLWHFPPKAAGLGLGQGTKDIIEFAAQLQPSKWVKPYSFMDPDFLETLFPLTMSYVDSRTEFSFWALWSSPLIVATDLRNLSEEKRSIIANEEVIAIDQDPAVVGGDRIANYTNGGQVWTKPLANGDIAVILYNPHDLEHIDVSVNWEQIGWGNSTSVVVRDLWEKSDIGTMDSGYTRKHLKAHDVAFLRLRKA